MNEPINTLVLISLVWTLGLGLDRWLGEPSRLHPVVALGTLASRLEHRWNRGRWRALRGGVAVGVLALPPVLVAVLLQWWLPVGAWVMISAVVLWLMVSWRALDEHGLAVSAPLEAGDLDSARSAVAMIVSRDTRNLNESEVARAATESVLENGADAIFASLFWFAVAGLPGLVLHRIANTLDAMWGYRTDRFQAFGRTAARLDDVLNWIPARLTAFSYSLMGQTRQGLRCWVEQGKRWYSPNAGPVMAAGAGALEVRLGGPAPYAGGIKERPLLGLGAEADAGSIVAAVRLVRRSVLLWLGVWLLLSVLILIGGLSG